MAIPQSFIQELINRTDVVEVVGRYVQLKKGGANYMGLCPFHGEKSPSFSVSPTKQFFHCFGCGKNGNAIGFLMEHGGMSFIEAVKDLAQSYGLQVPEDDADPAERQRAQQQRLRQATLNEVLEKAGESYRKHLKTSPQAVDYLKGRGLSGEVAKLFGLGYAPDGWRNLASVFTDYQDALLVESGLVISHEESGEEDKRYDRFRDRIMFPIRNVKGECIGFGGRVLGDGTPKYLNSPETPVFSKGRELYGLFEARTALREAGYVLVTEGYMDVVALAQLGFPNAVATLGTACTTDHVQKLFRFTDSVVFSFDGDAAGRRAARKALDGALPFATDTRNVKFLFLPAEHDPDSFVRAYGTDAFSRMVSDATPLSRFVMEVARDGCDIDTAEGRALFAAQAKPLWLAMPEGVLKSQLLKELADTVGIGQHELQRLWLATTPSAAPKASAKPVSKPGFANTGTWTRSGNNKHPPPIGINLRSKAPSRHDRALQILFADMAQWDGLSAHQQHLLLEMPAPYGELMAWLNQQWLENGVQSLAGLREGLRGHAHEAVVSRLIDDAPSDIDSDAGELQSILLALEKDQLAQEIDSLTRRMASDPDAYERIKELNSRLAVLKKAPLV
ncbi:MAG: DNA primase [Betaproteobacteria bacterium]|nr:DNA primase [Betaproteobacteria bacterium]NBY33939.1 DNA primase [Betaproteobacteria bacterium]